MEDHQADAVAVCEKRASFAHASSVKQLEPEGVVIISLGADLSSAARDAATSRVKDPVARPEAASNKSWVRAGELRQSDKAALQPKRSM